MRRAILIMAAAALMTTGARTTVFADAVTDCAKIQGTAFAKLFSAVIKGAAQSCGKGSAMAPLAVSQAKTGSAAGKFYGQVGKGVDKVGLAPCLINLSNLADPGIGLDPARVLDSISGLANAACLVP